MIRALYTTLILCCAVLLTVGCFSVKKEFPEKREFLIDVARDGEARAAANEAILVVRPFRISPAYQEQMFVYRMDVGEYETDFYNIFMVSPEAIIAQEAEEWLGKAGIFKNVVDSSSLVEPTHALEGSIVRIYGDFSETPKAVMEIQIALVALEGKPGIIMHKTYISEKPIDSDQPQDLIAGYEIALKDILMRAEEDLQAAVRPR